METDTVRSKRWYRVCHVASVKKRINRSKIPSHASRGLWSVFRTLAIPESADIHRDVCQVHGENATGDSTTVGQEMSATPRSSRFPRSEDDCAMRPGNTVIRIRSREIFPPDPERSSSRLGRFRNETPDADVMIVNTNWTEEKQRNKIDSIVSYYLDPITSSFLRFDNYSNWTKMADIFTVFLRRYATRIHSCTLATHALVFRVNIPQTYFVLYTIRQFLVVDVNIFVRTSRRFGFFLFYNICPRTQRRTFETSSPTNTT